MLAFAAGLKVLTLDRRNWTNRYRAWGKEPQRDSDLPDELIFEVARTDGERAYAQARVPNSLPIVQSEKYPNVAFVRGTDTMADVKSDIFRGVGYKDANFRKMVDQIKEFLQEHIEIDHVIAHSLGAALAIEGTKDIGRDVRVVGLDGALILVDGVDIKTRNINTNSYFDQQLDPFGPAEKQHEWNRFYSANTPSGKVGHRAFDKGVPYRKKFRGIVDKQYIKRTGYYSGKISYQSSHVGGASDRVDVAKIGVF